MKPHLVVAVVVLVVVSVVFFRAKKREGRKIVNSPQVKEIITIVENFIRDKKLICYGGTAINNILPVQDQFYDKSLEIPDYDFFSSNALHHAKELADIYSKLGFESVEAKAGVHFVGVSFTNMSFYCFL